LIVDCHCHVIAHAMTTKAVPERWRPRIERADGQQVVRFRGAPLRSVVGEFTDVDLMLAQAKAEGVDHLLLSPWIRLVPADAETEVGEAVEVCQVQNEGLSALATARPENISVLAAVPLQEPAVAADHLRDVMTLPGVRGAEVPASVSGRYLGDDSFEPFWAMAEQTGAFIFVHPTTTGFGLDALSPFYLWNSVGNPMETAVTAAHLAAAGVLERHPGLKIMLAHGGGGLLALRGRLRRAFAARPEARTRSALGPDAALRAFYYDSLTHDARLLADLIDYVGAEHVLLGSDRPFEMGTEHPVDEVHALGLGTHDTEAILGANARRLFSMIAEDPQSEPLKRLRDHGVGALDGPA
jgi:aminocarboxymuconate-semialdehyde decarboxylase